MTIQIKAATRLKITAGRETGQGAGALFYSADTGNFLILERSDTGDCAGQWCGLGGGVDDTDTSYEHTVRREAEEEAGFPQDAPCDLHFLNSDHQDDFVFHNYLAVVPQEFDPVLNDEHTDHKWVPYDQFADHEMHEGLMRSMNKPLGQMTLRQVCGVDPRCNVPAEES